MMRHVVDFYLDRLLQRDQPSLTVYSLTSQRLSGQAAKNACHLLPRLLERSGRTNRGSITGLYTVLVEGDDTNEPIADAVRGTLDGHVVLSRKLAEHGHFPAIDVLASVSRLMTDVTGDEHRRAATSLRQLLAAHRQAEDLISIGAYQHGANALVDAALRLQEPIRRFLQQDRTESAPLSEAIRLLSDLKRLREAGPFATADEPHPSKSERDST